MCCSRSSDSRELFGGGRVPLHAHTRFDGFPSINDGLRRVTRDLLCLALRSLEAGTTGSKLVHPDCLDHPPAMDRDEADFPAARFADDEEGGGEAVGDGKGDAADSPAPSQRDRAPSEVGGEEEGDDDEEEGEDIMKEGGNIIGTDEEGDSSEEEEDDPEEAKRIAEGFIDDDDADEDRDSDDDAERRRKRKKRKAKKRRRQRQQQGE